MKGHVVFRVAIVAGQGVGVGMFTSKSCSACGKSISGFASVGDYCPHCGARFISEKSEREHERQIARAKARKEMERRQRKAHKEHLAKYEDRIHALTSLLRELKKVSNSKIELDICRDKLSDMTRFGGTWATERRLRVVKRRLIREADRSIATFEEIFKTDQVFARAHPELAGVAPYLSDLREKADDVSPTLLEKIAAFLTGPGGVLIFIVMVPFLMVYGEAHNPESPMPSFSVFEWIVNVGGGILISIASAAFLNAHYLLALPVMLVEGLLQLPYVIAFQVKVWFARWLDRMRVV